MKIHIIGASGTGKSFIAEKISKQYNVNHYDLDNIFWDNKSKIYGTKMPVENRTQLLNDILKNDNWVIEGVFYDWLSDSFKNADMIFILITPSFIINKRIILRFLKRKLGILKSSKKESLSSLKQLLVWTNKFNKNNLPRIKEFLKPYDKKLVFLTKSNKIFEYLNFH